MTGAAAARAPRARLLASAPAWAMLAFALASPLAIAIRNTDFDKAYYAAARELWRTGSVHYSYEGLKNLPLVAGLLSPLGAFDRDTAARIFVALELAAYFAAFVTAAWGLARTPAERWLWLGLLAASRAWFVGLRLGQLTPVCLLFLLLALAAYGRRRPRTAGVCLALAFLVKIPAGLALLPFVLRRERAVVGAAAATFVGLVLLSLGLYGVAAHREFWQAVIAQNAGTALVAYNNVSLLGSAMRLLQALGPGPEGLFRWAPAPVPPWMGAAVAAAGLALLAGIARAIRRAARDGAREAWPLEVALAICASIAVFPVYWDHYLAFASIPLFFAVRAATREKTLAGWVSVAAVFACVNFPMRAALAAIDPDWRGLRSAVPAAPLLGVLGLLYLVQVQHRELRSRARSAPT